MQCSPANTAVQLTKVGRRQADGLAKTNPDKIAYVRLATTDDNQGAGGADIAVHTISAKTAYVLDDTQTYGKGVADGFTTPTRRSAATIAKRDGVPDTTTDFTSYVTTAKGSTPDVIFYGGVTTSGLGLFRKQMAQQGLDIPMVGGDGINDGSAATASSFLNIAGDGDANTYSTVAADPRHPEPGQVRGRLQGQVQHRSGVLQRAGLRLHAGVPRRPSRPSAPAPAATWPSCGRQSAPTSRIRRNTYDTVLGKVGFDADGDTSQHTISYYQFDPTDEGLEVHQAARLHGRPGQVAHH